MSNESHHIDKKSLRVINGNSARWNDVATDCVCFANASGGYLLIGIEDGEDQPSPAQRIAPDLLTRLRKRISELTVNVEVAPEIKVASNGGEYIALNITRSVGPASTVDGRYFQRVGDTCRPVVGDDVLRLLTDRPGLPWETLTNLQIPVAQADFNSRDALLGQLRASDRVKASVKEKSDIELLMHYGLSDGTWLTHLGVLMVGSAIDRARLGTAPVVQAIKFDELGQKINKWVWDDFGLSPVELIDAIWQDVADFHESYELADGLYRSKLPAYDPRVVRELLVNALVHRPYTQRGDLFLNLHPDRFEVVNPGRLPLGVTPKTMLHASRRRNDRMATLFHDLRLMEREGSGFDLIYDVQLSQGRPIPLPKEGIDSVSITVERRVKRPEVVRMMADADARYQLRQRERIVLGLLAASEGLTARELANQLELETPDDVRASWLGRLLELELVQSTGKTQATRYFVNPVVLKGQGLDGKTTLKRIEPHRLRALIVEDLRRYPGAASGDVNRRVGAEVPYRTLKRAIDELVEQGSLRFVGLSRGRRYWLVEQLEK